MKEGRIRPAEGGACIDNVSGIFQRCVYESTSCPLGTKYLSARELGNIDPNDTNHRCNTNNNDFISIGKCILDNTRNNGGISDHNLCTGNKSNCLGCVATGNEENCYETIDEDCTIYGNHKKKGYNNYDFIDTHHFTTAFGMCLQSNIIDEIPSPPVLDDNNNNCYWSKEECITDDSSVINVWVPAIEVYNKYGLEPCTCDKVKVGACRDASGVIACAVSKDACANEGELYFTAQQLRDPSIMPSGVIDCRLCDIDTLRKSNTKENNKSASTTTTFIGIALSITVLSVVAILGVVYYTKRSSKNIVRNAASEGIVLDADGSNFYE